MYVGLDKIDIIAEREALAIKRMKSYSTIYKSRRGGSINHIVEGLMRKRPGKTKVIQRPL